jgi:hypothetical protein
MCESVYLTLKKSVSIPGKSISEFYVKLVSKISAVKWHYAVWMTLFNSLIKKLIFKKPI